MFEKTLNDLVTGIRSHNRDTTLFISNAISECKTELKSSDLFIKANALEKLTFLQMMGYTMSWAAFSSVEVMSSPRFALKRVGYLAACQGLDQPDKSPVVLLTTNMLKKELRGATVGGSGENMYHAGLAINALSNIVTEDLGRELLPELLHLLQHPSPYVRKKALLCLYKVFLKYPQGLRLSFDKIKLCLDDSNTSVVSCAVNVITELSDKNPKNYLPLAPAFFKLLTSSANNWMLIKVVKLLGSLVPEEPRLARKLLEPLCNIVKTTHAKSLLYEAVYAITLCLQYVKKQDGTQPSNIPQVVDLCVDTLKGFVQDNDQNLKYLGLVGFGSLLTSQPKVLHSQSECKVLILKCLSDEDVTIRTRALGLLNFMTTKRNLVELITQLLGHVEAATGEYRCDLVEEIIRMCSSNKYELLVDFTWYFDVLVTLAGVRGIENQGEVIAKQWMDVAWRVLPVRGYAVKRSLEVLLCRGPGAAGDESNRDGDRHILPEILPAAAWIVGEYSLLLPEALGISDGDDELDTRYDSTTKGAYHGAIQSMTSPADTAGVSPIPSNTQWVFVQNAMKVFAAACQRNIQANGNNNISLDGLGCSDDELLACVSTLMANLEIYMESPDAEVKERAFTSYQLLLSLGLPKGVSAFSAADSIASTFRNASPTLTYLLIPEPMRPISAKAQRRKLAEGPPSPISVEEWDRDVNWDALWFLEEETPMFDRNGNVKGSGESVSFTKQQTSVPSYGGGNDDVISGTGTEQPRSLGEADNILFGRTTKSFYSDATSGPSRAPPSSTRREGDPFYLNSAPPSGELLGTTFSNSPEKTSKDAADAAASRFGSIRLDSGGESDEGIGDRKAAKKRKKAKKKTGDINLASLGPSLKIDITGSDEEDDTKLYQPKRGSQTNKPGRAKEFEILAQVDLTTPLGEHEVMPKNEHYVVPDRPRAQPEPKIKKQKKKKDKKKKASKQEQPSARAATGDLLGFDTMAFDPIAQSSSTQAAAANPMTTAAPVYSTPAHNTISNAFDDLLGLEMPTSLPTSAPTSEQPVISSNNQDKEVKKAAKKAKKLKKEKKSKQ
jgi:AP-3 complex subunit delta-1